MAAAASSGNTNSTSTLTTRMFQVKIGIRNITMPGARMHTMVVIMFTAPRMVPRPPTATPKIHKSPPAPGEWMASESGV
ncbi:Uncharacterised protein [Mycobacteroides abscessus subsp. abscessus]|nr:Uncharacterised protein [Mycobacteroides abscessus]SHQ82281.1 Uncharacterised protein [Mycobacteroides abscessus subsp. abscessus]CPV17259.1 Uncharacterised protein [Mycobacteroides abscessus]CPZ71376.1 Uncharacterised protein [Mycobacteroides abscessus]SHQ85260.1 Uncharacterised protein [Mycobacteroides abscessus subsp. abscessus]